MSHTKSLFIRCSILIPMRRFKGTITTNIVHSTRLKHDGLKERRLKGPMNRLIFWHLVLFLNDPIESKLATHVLMHKKFQNQKSSSPSSNFQHTYSYYFQHLITVIQGL